MADLPENLLARPVSEFEKPGLLSRAHHVLISSGCCGWHVGRNLRLNPGRHEVAPGDQVLLFRSGEFELEFQASDLVVDAREVVQAQVSQWLRVHDPARLQTLANSSGDVLYDALYERGISNLRHALTGVVHQYGAIPIRDDPMVRCQAEHELKATLLERWHPYGVVLSDQEHAVQIRSLSVDDDRLATIRIREGHLRQLAEDMARLEGEARLRAQERQVELSKEIARLERELATEQAKTAQVLRDLEQQDRALCPIGQHDVPKADTFVCANPRCQRRVCLTHLDPGGRDDVQSRICLDCGQAWRAQQEKAARGLRPCAECGRMVRREATFVCKQCGREGLCLDACHHPARRICIACAAHATMTAATSRPEPASGTDAALRQLLALADWPEIFRVRVWANTSAETSRRATRDVAVVPKTDRGRFQTGTPLSFSVRSDRQCYLTLLNAGPTGNLALLLPNFWRRCNLLRANTTWMLPDPLMSRDFSFELRPPEGRELIIAVGSIEPLSEFWISELTLECPFYRAPADWAAETAKRIAEQLRARKALEWGLGYCAFEHDGQPALYEGGN